MLRSFHCFLQTLCAIASAVGGPVGDWFAQANQRITDFAPENHSRLASVRVDEERIGYTPTFILPSGYPQIGHPNPHYGCKVPLPNADAGRWRMESLASLSERGFH